jgi:hypothetical protein
MEHLLQEHLLKPRSWKKNLKANEFLGGRRSVHKAAFDRRKALDEEMWPPGTDHPYH